MQVDAAPADAPLPCASRCGLVPRSHLRVAGEASAAFTPLGEGHGGADRLGRSLPRGKAFGFAEELALEERYREEYYTK